VAGKNLKFNKSIDRRPGAPRNLAAKKYVGAARGGKTRRC
jgi:hypothetical protein